MTATETNENIVAAKRRLARAAAKLIDPQTKPGRSRSDVAFIAPSLYHQLADSVAGQTGERNGSRIGLPIWVDCFDLKQDIDTTIATWCPNGIGTVHRIAIMAKAKWRPQDTELVELIGTSIEAWIKSITKLLDPEPKWSLPNPCPACQARVVYREQAGEEVRHPALQIGMNGCECLKCHTVWSPDLFAHLARVLGYDPKQSGVLE